MDPSIITTTSPPRSRDAAVVSANAPVAGARRVTSADYVEFLRRSGLLDKRRVDEALAETTQGADWTHEPDYPERLSQWLFERNLLTPWQHQQLMQGAFQGLVVDRYKLLGVVGGGGMSTVFLAEHRLMRRRVALKVLSAALEADQGGVERFYREAEAVARLSHPGIVQVHDVATHGSCHYLVMEYVEGHSLRQVIADRGPLPVHTAATYIMEVADALAHAHERGIIHRDIKPDNLLLDTTGHVKMLDLGLARLTGAEGNLTRADALLGTVDFIAPEQAEDSRQVDARADLYSLGCTLYFLLVGHAPFPTGTTAQRVLSHMLKAPEPLSKFRADVPADLAELCQRLMAKQPADRPASAAALAQELSNWLSANPAPAGVDSPPPTGAFPTSAVASTSTLHTPGVTTQEPKPEISSQRSADSQDRLQTGSTVSALGSTGSGKPPGTGLPAGSTIATKGGDSAPQTASAQPSVSPHPGDAKPAQTKSGPTPVRPILAFCAQASAGEPALHTSAMPGSSIIERPSMTERYGRRSEGNPSPERAPASGNVRVTLRRLLDYVHGNLDTEAKAAIRAKIAPLPHLLTLLERIRQTPTQDYLGAPAVDDQLVEAATAAAYLDQNLVEKRHELEQVCLKGDAYLAEIAHCHAILAELRSGNAPKVSVSRGLRARLHRLADAQSETQPG